MVSTNELRERLAEAIRDKYMSYGYGRTTWESSPYQDYWRSMADVALRVCQEVGMVIISDNQEIPLPSWDETKDTAVALDRDTWAKWLAYTAVLIDRMREVGWKRTEALIIEEDDNG